ASVIKLTAGVYCTKLSKKQILEFFYFWLILFIELIRNRNYKELQKAISSMAFCISTALKKCCFSGLNHSTNSVKATRIPGSWKKPACPSIPILRLNASKFIDTCNKCVIDLGNTRIYLLDSTYLF